MILLVPKQTIPKGAWSNRPLAEYDKRVLAALFAFSNEKSYFLMGITEGVRVNVVINITEPEKVGIFHINEVQEWIDVIVRNT